jgi:hypothetical protein
MEDSSDVLHTLVLERRSQRETNPSFPEETRRPERDRRDVACAERDCVRCKVDLSNMWMRFEGDETAAA